VLLASSIGPFEFGALGWILGGFGFALCAALEVVVLPRRAGIRRAAAARRALAGTAAVLVVALALFAFAPAAPGALETLLALLGPLGYFALFAGGASLSFNLGRLLGARSFDRHERRRRRALARGASPRATGWRAAGAALLVLATFWFAWKLGLAIADRYR